MKKHIQIIGVLHLILGVLQLISTFLVMTIDISSLIKVAESNAKLLTVALIFLSILSFLGGIGLLMYKSWARYLIIILSFISLLFFPIGTIIGVYSIWILFKKEVIAQFNPENDISGNNDWLD